MPLSAGDKLGPYEILAPIGTGGMGDVYRARDPRLNRDVAIKVSAAEFSERFEREAKSIAALNHPNICQVYDVGPNYLVMEFIEGAPLHGPLPLDEALRHAVQIAGALSAAHAKGITHRDLKPANILVTAHGIKLLDFGLALLSRDGDGREWAPDATTISMTQTGTILGTAAYMSPEQAEAKPVDARSDIFSFGLVLYEMLSGRRAFTGDSAIAIIAAILHKEPEPLQAPPALQSILFFEERVKIGDSAVLLAGQLESQGWLVTSRSQDGMALKFRLLRNLTRDEAIEQAAGYVTMKAGPQFRDLTENERRTCERMAVSNRLNALVFYIQCRLPEGAAGDELAILNFAADEKISEIVEEAVANVYYFNNIRADENFFDWVRQHDDGRTWTLTLLDVAFAKYQVATALDKLDVQDVPTIEDFDQMSDAEIESTLLAARKLRAGR